MAKKITTANKKPITPTLMELKIDEQANFGYIQYSSVLSTITRLHTETDLRFTTEKIKQTRQVIVTREF